MFLKKTFRGPFRQSSQSGNGLGTMFSKLANWLMPLIRKASPAIKSTLVSAGKSALKNPEVVKAVQNIHANIVSAGTKAASRLITGQAMHRPDLEKAKEASAKVDAALREQSLSSTVGPEILPATTSIVGRRNSTLAANQSKKRRGAKRPKALPKARKPQSKKKKITRFLY
jgi:hypothetical protein